MTSQMGDTNKKDNANNLQEMQAILNGPFFNLAWKIYVEQGEEDKSCTQVNWLT